MAFAKMRYVGVNRGIRECGEQVAKDTIDLCVDVVSRLDTVTDAGSFQDNAANALRELKEAKP